MSDIQGIVIVGKHDRVARRTDTGVVWFRMPSGWVEASATGKIAASFIPTGEES